MALQMTPDGQPFYIPDNIAGIPEYPTTTGVPTLPTQHVSAMEYDPGLAAGMALPPPKPPPPPPPPQHFGINPLDGASELPSTPEPGPSSVTGGALPSAVQQGVMNGFAPAQSSPDFQASPQQTKAVQKADAEANKAYDKAQVAQAKQNAARAAYAATPQGMQDQAAQGQLAANADQQKIALAQGENDSAQATEESRIKDKALADQQVLAVKQEKERQARIAQEQALHADYTKAVDDAAKKTIDPNRYWSSMSTGKHVSTAIAVMLSGIGQGLVAAGGGGQVSNAAMSMITSAIDRDVDAQKADMAQANATVNAKRNSFMDYHTLSGDMDSAAALKKAEGRVMVADQLDANAAHFKGQNAQLAAQTNAAALRYSANNIIADLASKKVAQDEKRQELANQRAQVGIAAGHLQIARDKDKRDAANDTRDFAEKQREFDMGLAEKMATAKAAGKTSEVKQLEDLRKYALRDPQTGNVILDPAGEAKAKRADAMEVQARTAKTPAQADALRVQATALREEAERENHISHEKAPEVQESLNAAQNVLDSVSQMKAELEKDPGMTDRETWAKLGTQFAHAKAQAIHFYGAKPSSREMEAFEEFMGADGSKLGDRAIGKGKMEAHLKALGDTMEGDVDTTLRGAGYKGGFHIRATEGTPIETIGDQTSVEAAAGAKKGAIGAQLPDADLKFRSNKTRELQAENSTPSGPTGLSLHDTAKVSTLIGNYNIASDAEQGKILTQLTAYAQSPREAIANGSIGLIRANPEVFQKIISVLPPEQQAQWKQFESAGGIRPIQVGPAPVAPQQSFTPPGGVPR